MRGATEPNILAREPDDVFQSTRPMRGATNGDACRRREKRISIHAPHAGRDLVFGYCLVKRCAISIHAPHAGRDAAREMQEEHDAQISIHAPHAGRDIDNS